MSQRDINYIRKYIKCKGTDYCKGKTQTEDWIKANN